MPISRQEKDYVDGYTYAKTEYALAHLPIDILTDMVDANKELALKNESAFYLGIAKAAEEEIGDRYYDEGDIAA